MEPLGASCISRIPKRIGFRFRGSGLRLTASGLRPAIIHPDITIFRYLRQGWHFCEVESLGVSTKIRIQCSWPALAGWIEASDFSSCSRMLSITWKECVMSGTEYEPIRRRDD